MPDTTTPMIDTIRHIKNIVTTFWQDAAYTAPEARGEMEARALNSIWVALQEGANSEEAVSLRDDRDRYREALEEIAATSHVDAALDGGRAIRVARAAIKPTGDNDA